MKFLSSTYFFSLSLLLQIVLWFVVKDDPFFGDSIASTSQAASHIYAHQLSTIFYPAYADPGHPTLYAYGLAVCWVLFGKTLAIAHLYSCLWAVALLVAFRKVASCLLSKTETNVATVLVMLFPTYLAQSAMMLNTVALVTFFLLAVYGVFKQNRITILIAASLMCVTHLQSAFLLLSLACFDMVYSLSASNYASILRWLKQKTWVYAIPAMLFGSWLIIHQQHTGWLLVSPQYNDANELNGVSEYIKALLLMCWRLVDYGMLPFYMIIGWLVFKQQQSRRAFIQLAALIIPCCLAMAIFLNHTIGHRYFMAFGMLVILYCVYLTKYLQPLPRVIVYTALALSLFAGNFLFYPGKNLGDATLGYRSYFSLITKARSAALGSSYSHAPIANDDSLTYLHSTPFKPILRINEFMLDTLPVVIQSNVNAEFTVEDKKLLATWYGTSFEQGAVYINVFTNPKYNGKPQGWKVRKPSMMEQWMMDVKKKFGR
ncbi:hypothetical protein AEM51_12670 [Bacteroidetes bacterium UKL13-3]|jgi:hypothetical protein|nr:hypothetical protein AEM51_12670 [Bacteroidetes bacterium UKL13-3]HCP93051.1 hypothetical protein [Bacteroidota bacterium]